MDINQMQLLEQMHKEDAQREDLSKVMETEQFKFSQILLENDLKHVPKNIPKSFWAFFDKELSLTNFTPEDIRSNMFMFDIAKLDLMMSQTDFDMKFEDQIDFTNLKVKAFAKMKRSFGSDRERVMLASQIRQVISTEKGGVSGGFLSKMFGGRS